MASLAQAWLGRLPAEGRLDLTVSLDRFPELRDAISPPTFSVAVRDGMVTGEGDYIEAAIDAYLVPEGAEPPRDGSEDAISCGDIDLDLDLETRELRLSTLDVPPEAQAAGLGSLVMAQLAELGEDLGLWSICLEAGNVGRWAWMRCGFDFDDPAGRDAVVGAATDFAQALGRDVDPSEIEHAWDFVELPGTVSAEEIQAAGGVAIRSAGRPISLGKALVLGPPSAANPWWGRLRLDPGDTGRIRLKEYVASYGSSS